MSTRSLNQKRPTIIRFAPIKR